MTLVVDASAVAAALADAGDDGAWARTLLRAEDLVAPPHLPVEVSSVLRRAVLHGRLSSDAGALAHRALVDLPVTTFPFAPLAARVWELHPTVTPYDAGYVALAEALDCPLATLDRRLTRASGPTCSFHTPTGE